MKKKIVQENLNKLIQYYKYNTGMDSQVLKKTSVYYIDEEELKKEPMNPPLSHMPKISSSVFDDKNTKLIHLLSEKNYNQRTNEAYLYHGTTMKSVLSMLSIGVIPKKNHGVLGYGIYMTPSANMALKWSRDNPRVIVVFAVKNADKVRVCCVGRNTKLQKDCCNDSEFYTSFETALMTHKYSQGFLPYFWQYIVKDEDLFQSESIYIKKIYIIIGEEQMRGGGA